VRAIDPTAHVVAVAEGKRRWGSLVPAEVVAAAKQEQVEVRLTPGNAAGQLRRALEEAGIRFAVWSLEADVDEQTMRVVGSPIL
jgi:hypothetical protein